MDDLSNWYVRRSRSRFWGEGDDLQDALWTLYEVLVATSRLIAPFVPFTAEALYRALVVQARPQAPESVHLTDWPGVDTALLDPQLDADMALVRSVTSLGLAARGAALEQAACWGVALHARAGERLAERMGVLGYLAREIADEIPALLESVAGREAGNAKER